MVTVYVEDGNLERSIKKFKKLCEKAGVFDDIRKNSYYMKPSERKKAKRKEARRRRLQELREQGFSV